MKQNPDFRGFKAAEPRVSLKYQIRRAAASLARLIAIVGAAIVLSAFGVAQAASSGPASGGNTITINGTGLGNGSDITNVTICGVVAVIQSQTADSVTVVVGAVGDGGTGDILVFSASAGVTTFVNGYTYNRPGAVFGPLMGWTSVSNLPVGRAQSPVVSVNGKIYDIGGSDNSSGALSTVYVYNPAHPKRRWLRLNNLPVESAPAAAVSVNGKIYAIAVGGAGVYVYDPAKPTRGWLSLSNLPTAPSYFAAAAANGKIYAIGEGASGNGVCVYDPAQPTLGWLSVSNLPGRGLIAEVTATTLDGKIYLMGGESNGVLVYDPSQPTLGWVTVSSLPGYLAGMAAAGMDGKIYCVGGFDFGSEKGLSSVYVYDPEQPALGWLSVSNLPATEWFSSAVSVDGNLYVVGGWNNGDVYSTVYESSFASGVVPSSGPVAGGSTISINGNNLGSGDVTNVTLCGIPATILADYSPTQIVVTAGAAAIPCQGNVVVRSASYGLTVSSNAYTYQPPAPDALPATNVATNSFHANWSRVSGATDYVLDVSTASNFTSNVARYNNLSVGNVSTFLVRGLNPATSYYYRVRCRQHGITSGNSSVISVQTSE